jgi:hypothetical protein
MVPRPRPRRLLPRPTGAVPRGRRVRRAGPLLAVVLLGLGIAGAAEAYQARLHQRLTFLGAREFNRCNASLAVPPLTALQIRYIVRGAVEEGASPIGRLFRWRYYAPRDDGARLLWLVETRLGRRFDRAVRDFREADDDARRYRALGVILYYLQLMTSPPHVVPVYQPRFWLGQLDDAFNRYPVDADRVAAALDGWCPDRAGLPSGGFEALLDATARRTRAALTEPLPDFGVDWQVFWRMDQDPDAFGSYGPAGNEFGKETRFPCAAGRCVLLRDDPLYQAFAAERHADAVRVTVRALMGVQAERERADDSAEGPAPAP